MYEFQDVSAFTLPTVYGIRTVPRRGAIIHTTMGYDSLDWLQGGSALEGRPASACFLLPRNGDILQLIRPGCYSYHTGTARHKLRQDDDYTLNKSYVGIELEVAEHKGQRLSNAQIISLAALNRRLINFHRFELDDFATHKMVALPKGRKKDPIYLPWHLVLREMEKPSKESPYDRIPVVLP